MTNNNIQVIRAQAEERNREGEKGREKE